MPNQGQTIVIVMWSRAVGRGLIGGNCRSKLPLHVRRLLSSPARQRVRRGICSTSNQLPQFQRLTMLSNRILWQCVHS
jgi:hypothetical protein